MRGGKAAKAGRGRKAGLGAARRGGVRAPVDVALEGADELVLHARDALDDVVVVSPCLGVLQQRTLHAIESDLAGAQVRLRVGRQRESVWD